MTEFNPPTSTTGPTGPNDGAAIALADSAAEMETRAFEAAQRMHEANLARTKDPSKPQIPAATQPQPDAGQEQPAAGAGADNASPPDLAIQPKKEGDPSGQRPAGLPEKFKTVEELTKAYKELEAKQSAGKSQEGQLISQEELTSYSAEIAEGGDLSAENYAKLSKKGIPPELVKSYVDNFKLRGQQMVSDAMKLVGGQESYKAMASWAADNVPAAELQVFNAAVKSTNPAQVSAAINGMYARFAAAGGAAPMSSAPLADSGAPVRLVGSSGGAGGAAPYTSMAEANLDFNNPLYRVSPDFRAYVEARMAASAIE